MNAADSKLDSVTFDRFIEKQNPFLSDPCALDLTGISFISPSALTQLAAVCHALSNAGRCPVIRVSDESVRNYLIRSSFLELIKSVATIEPPVSGFLSQWYELRHGRNPLLIELTKIESGAALPNLLSKIVKVLHYRLRYRKNDAFDVATVVSELAQNTFDHNDTTCGFLAMQVFGKGNKRFLEIGVADFGVGLTETLRRNKNNYAIHTDLHAIQFAIRLGTSQHEDPTRGTGLYHLLEIAYKHQGSIQIWNGNAKMRYRFDRREGFNFTVTRLPGVHVALSLSTKIP